MNEDLTREVVIRDYLIKILLQNRGGRGIGFIIAEANFLFNLIIKLESSVFNTHEDIDLPLGIKANLNGVQRVFLYGVTRVLEGRTHETIELIVANARDVTSFIWNPNSENHYLPINGQHV